MLKNHPRGLLVAFFSNMGERFGFYTMMAILVLFLQAKFGLSADKAGGIYSWFYFSIYALALLGGILADSTKKYKLVILAGIIIMFAGYIIVAVPGMTLNITIVGLFTIALGNGLLKGNLQAVVRQKYEDPKSLKLRITSLVLVFIVAVFFWMSFHQNGLTLTLFARDYTVKQVGIFTNMFFTLPSILAVIGAIAGIVLLFSRKLKRNEKIAGGVLLLISLWFIMFFTYGFDPTTILSKVFGLTKFSLQNSISPEVCLLYTSDAADE